MAFLMNPVRRSIKPISQLVLLMLLIWFFLPDTKSNNQRANQIILKENTDHFKIQLAVSKQESVYPIVKQLSGAPQEGFLVPVLRPVKGLFKSFLRINSFVRNTFYVYTTINAP